MNRTRTVFFSVLAVVLLILFVSLAGRLISERAVTQIFIAAAVFGIGVVLLDFFGILGGHHGGDTGDGAFDLGTHDAAGHIGDLHGADGAHDFGGGHDLSGHDFAGHDGAAGHDGGHDAAAGHDSAHDAAHDAASQGPAQPAAAPILSVLTYLRLFVYFCLGFGPAGWAALAAGLGPLFALLIAAPFGLLSVFLARAFFRFQRRDTGRVGSARDLLREEAQVIVPLTHETMGKVRVRAGQSVSDLYALAADPGAEYERGATVRIVEVSADAVLVR